MVWARASFCRTTGSSTLPVFCASCTMSGAIGPGPDADVPSLGRPAPRSSTSIVWVTDQPSLTRPITSPPGIRRCRRISLAQIPEVSPIGLIGRIVRPTELQGTTNDVRPCVPGLPIGSGQAQAEVRQMGKRTPDFLAVENPLLAFLGGLRADTSQVGARRGLREELAHERSPASTVGTKRRRKSGEAWASIVGTQMWKVVALSTPKSGVMYVAASSKKADSNSAGSP